MKLLTRRQKISQRVQDCNAAWLRAERDRRRLALTTSQQQRRDGIERLARDGLHPVTLPSLNDAFSELMPPSL